MKVIYTAEATAYGPREGRVVSSDDQLDIELVRPAEMGGPGGEGTNPEQLFAGGYAACFFSAMRRPAREMKADLEGAEVTAQVDLGTDDARRYSLAVRLEVKLPKVDPETAQKLLEETHQVCPYSNATRGNIDVELSVVS
ncbi:MAG: organic hydroperoxide resistance protein [Mycobacteriales bacterium]